MKRYYIVLVLALTALLLSGCGKTETTENSPAPTPAVSTTPRTKAYAYELGSKKKGDKGLCCVCVTNGGPLAEEEVADSIDYEGKTYLFCNEQEKAKFISEPAKFAVQ